MHSATVGSAQLRPCRSSTDWLSMLIDKVELAVFQQSFPLTKLIVKYERSVGIEMVGTFVDAQPILFTSWLVELDGKRLWAFKNGRISQVFVNHAHFEIFHRSVSLLPQKFIHRLGSSEKILDKILCSLGWISNQIFNKLNHRFDLRSGKIAQTLFFMLF